MNRLEALADKMECMEVIARFARAIDRCDAELLRTIFHPDGTDDHGAFVGTADEFIEWVIPLLKTMKWTQHVIGQSLVELDGDTAAAESYFMAHHGIAGPDGDIFMIVAGRYLDRLKKRDGVWKISHRHAVYDWNSTGPLTDSYDRGGNGPSAYGMRGTGDASYLHLAGGGNPPAE